MFELKKCLPDVLVFNFAHFILLERRRFASIHVNRNGQTGLCALPPGNILAQG